MFSDPDPFLMNLNRFNNIRLDLDAYSMLDVELEADYPRYRFVLISPRRLIGLLYLFLQTHGSRFSGKPTICPRW